MNLGKFSKKRKKAGTVLILAITFTAIITIIAFGITQLVVTEYKLAIRQYHKKLSFEIAEAGINYYRWHLYHNPQDYQDGASPPEENSGEDGFFGPFVHDFNDPQGGKLGEFSLKIKPPDIGSSAVIVHSTGYTSTYPNIQTTLEAQFGLRSLTDYSFLLNGNLTVFSSTSETWGKIHSNGKIRFDGICHSKVTSAKTNGITGTGGPQDLWEYPVPVIDFALITRDLAYLKEEANAEGGFYRDDSGKYGYHIIFKAGGTFDLYRVDSVKKPWQAGGQDEIWKESLLGNYALPSKGIIFIEDDVWVEGVMAGRVTVAAARFPEVPSQYADIRIDDNLTYLARDGTCALGLIGQEDVKIIYSVPSEMKIDGMMLAQYGAVYRDNYFDQLDSLTVFGGIISNKQSGFKYLFSGETYGFYNTYYIFDSTLVFAPPPYFPTYGEYTMIYWKEL
ncbi:hypothetical protein COY23_03900 [bacterium (Candidatus Torokbacteria) CG_4_10_14_0_2_um_filter_35_8]|nr:MAG: hypothetical protein COY23_03900 [bacterium (Candidatus Torokbacteria) CG_4_10_14_0_2_um_filter_35_8]